MTPETSQYMAKSRVSLSEARQIARIGLSKAAARSAYDAVFHAAEAFLFEKNGKVAKTHTGVRSEFLRLTNNTSDVDLESNCFFARAYKLKETADYGDVDEGNVSADKLNVIINNSETFINQVLLAMGHDL